MSIAFWMVVLSFAGVFAIFTLGLQIQVGVAGLPNFGHVAFMAVGGYTFALLVAKLNMPFVPALLLALVACVLAGLIIAWPALRMRPAYLAIAMLAYGEIIRAILLNEGFTNGARGVGGYDGGWKSFAAFIAELAKSLGWSRPDPGLAMVVATWVVAVAIAAILRILNRSPWGRTVRAIREDQNAAAALGKPVLRRRLEVLSIGAAIGGLSGIFYAFSIAHLSPAFFDPSVTFLAYAMLVLGGVSSQMGALIGAFLLSILYAGASFLDLPFTAQQVSSLRLVIIGLVLMLLIAFRPQGILGDREEMTFE